MAHDVFISYSSSDKPIADAVCASLERENARCWIAPRDVVPGVNYGEAIIDAINECQVLVLVFSSESNSSQQVMREVERAVSKEKTIIPFRINDILPSKTMEYLVSAPHWLDAITPPIEKHLQQLTKIVGKLIDPGESTRSLVPSSDAGTVERPNLNSNQRFRASYVWLAIVGCVALLLIGTFAYLELIQNEKRGPDLSAGKNESAGSLKSEKEQPNGAVDSIENHDAISRATAMVLRVERSQFSNGKIYETIEGTWSALKISPGGYYLSWGNIPGHTNEDGAYVSRLGEEWIEEGKFGITFEKEGYETSVCTSMKDRLVLYVDGEFRPATLKYISGTGGLSILHTGQSDNTPYFALSKLLPTQETEVYSLWKSAMTPDVKDKRILVMKGESDVSALSDLKPHPATSTMGRASKITENGNYIVHSSALNPAAVGGPLVDTNGTVLGINLGTQDGAGIAAATAAIQAEIEKELPGVVEWR